MLRKPNGEIGGKRGWREPERKSAKVEGNLVLPKEARRQEIKMTGAKEGK